jgi:hypothetical protein
VLAKDRMQDSQELADEAFSDLLRKYGRAAMALLRRARSAVTVIVLRCSSLLPKQNQPHVAHKVRDQASKRRQLVLP